MSSFDVSKVLRRSFTHDKSTFAFIQQCIQDYAYQGFNTITDMKKNEPKHLSGLAWELFLNLISRKLSQ